MQSGWKKACLGAWVVLVSGGVPRAETLAGRVVDPMTGSGVGGVRVSKVLAGKSTFTDADGSWILEDSSVSIRKKGASARTAASIVPSGSTLRVLREGRDALGRGADRDVRSLEGMVPSQPRRSTAIVDTLVYSWNGRPFLRDTVSTSAVGAVVRDFDTTVNPTVIHGYLLDSRDGSRYRTVKLGDQEWMAQNLGLNQAPNWCYDDDSGNCRRQGRLYPWSAANGYGDTCDILSCPATDAEVVGICASGWHLPSLNEWKTLQAWIASQPGWDKPHAGEPLKSSHGWSQGVPADPFGFRALPAGDRYFVGEFYEFGTYGVFWTSTERTEGQAWHAFVTVGDSALHLHDGCDKPDGFSVRCVRNK